MNNTEKITETVREEDMDLVLEPLQNLVSGTFLDNPVFYIITIAAVTFTAGYIIKFVFREVFIKIFAKTKTNLDDKIIAIVEKPIFNTVLWIGFLVGAFIFLSDYPWWIYVSKAIITIIAVIWFTTGLQIIKTILNYLAGKKQVGFIKKQTMPLFDNIAFLLVFVIGFYIIAASIWKVDMTAFIASLGVMGLAVGFAAKDTIANLFAGVFILADQPYKIGDYIVLDSGERGKVRHIGIRSTRILTRSDVEITIPNSIMGNTKVTNESGGPEKKTRVFVNVGIAYGEDVKNAEELILEKLEKIEIVEKTPAARVRFREMGASSLNLQVLFWVSSPSKKGLAVHTINSEIYNLFNENNIEIPYQKQDLYIKEFPKQ